MIERRSFITGLIALAATPMPTTSDQSPVRIRGMRVSGEIKYIRYDDDSTEWVHLQFKKPYMLVDGAWRAI